MNKIKNWLIPALAIILAVLEYSLDGFKELVEEVGLPNYYVSVFRFVALVLTIIYAKLAPPSLKKANEANNEKLQE